MTRLWTTRILGRNRTLTFTFPDFVYISDGLLKRDLLGGRPVKQVIFRPINDISQERKKVVKSEIEFGLLFMSPEWCS